MAQRFEAKKASKKRNNEIWMKWRTFEMKSNSMKPHRRIAMKSERKQSGGERIENGGLKASKLMAKKEKTLRRSYTTGEEEAWRGMK